MDFVDSVNSVWLSVSSVPSVVSAVIRVYSCSFVVRDLSRRSEADLDRCIWLLRIHDHVLRRLHIHELVFDLFYWFQRKFLIFSHVELQASAPIINEGGHGLRRGRDLSLYQCDLRMSGRLIDQQLRSVLLHPVPIAFTLLGKLHDLEISAADDITDLQELCRLSLVDRVNAEFVFYPR